MQSKTVLITGCAGFIGSHLAEKLIDQGCKVVGLDNFDEYYSKSRKQHNLKNLLLQKNFSFSEGDICDSKALEKLFKKNRFDCVVHLAAKGGVRKSIVSPEEYVQVNIGGTTQVLQACKNFKTRQFIFASSSSVYGNRREGPFSEKMSTDKQISPYAVTKKTGELLAYTYAHLYKINTTVFRFFTVYGPRNRPNMACSNFAEALLKGLPITQYGDGSSGRDYTYIDDVINGIVSAIKQPSRFEIINLGNSNPIKLKELIETFEKVIGTSAIITQKPQQAGDVELTYANIDKAQKLLVWKPTTDLTTGISKLVRWYKQNQSLF